MRYAQIKPDTTPCYRRALNTHRFYSLWSYLDPIPMNTEGGLQGSCLSQVVTFPFLLCLLWWYLLKPWLYQRLCHQHSLDGWLSLSYIVAKVANASRSWRPMSTLRAHPLIPTETAGVLCFQHPNIPQLSSHPGLFISVPPGRSSYEG